MDKSLQISVVNAIAPDLRLDTLEALPDDYLEGEFEASVYQLLWAWQEGSKGRSDSIGTDLTAQAIAVFYDDVYQEWRFDWDWRSDWEEERLDEWKCKKGKPCKGRCIAQSKTCKGEGIAEEKKPKAKALKEKAKKEKSPKTSTPKEPSPEPTKSKKRKSKSKTEEPEQSKPVSSTETSKSKATKPKPEQSSQQSDFPESLSNLEEVRSLGGSTGAKLMRDPVTGKQFVVKSGSSPDHIREEMAADAAYAALGVPVPKSRAYTDSDGNPIKVAEYIEGRSLGEVMSSKNKAEIAKVRSQLQQNFAADALLGNWDVVGLNSDNVLIDENGTVWRIDNGGSLRRRAQGELKGDRWNDYPTELFSLRDPKVNRQTADTFNGLSHSDLVGQIEGIGAQRSKLLESLPDDLKSSVGRRLDEMERVAEISRTLEGDRFNEAYQSNFTRHSLNMRANGIVDRMPTEMRLGEDSIMYDANGQAFDSLRGKNSILNDFSDYVKSEKGDYEQISSWLKDQSTSSWSGRSQATKAFIAESRDNWDDHFWISGQDEAQKQLSNFRDRSFDSTFAAYHAFNYEMFQKIDMPGNDRANGTFEIIRTEGKAILDSYGVQEGTGQKMMRGAAESGSMFNPVQAWGEEVTVQRVPHHRIIGNYLHARERNGTRTAFMSDDENEILFIPDGIEFEYMGSLNNESSARARKSRNFN